MLSARPDLSLAMPDSGTPFAITLGTGGFAFRTNYGSFRLVSHVPGVDKNCYVFIHEFAHLIHAVLEELPGGDEFNKRLEAAYQAALTAGLWDDQ